MLPRAHRIWRPLAAFLLALALSATSLAGAVLGGLAGVGGSVERRVLLVIGGSEEEKSALCGGAWKTAWEP